MMKAAKNWSGDNAVLTTNPMTVQHRRGTAASGKTRPEAHVRTPVIVVRHPPAEDVPEVTLVQRNHSVQALTSHCANHPLTERIGLWRSHRRLEERRPHRRDPAINFVGGDALAVVRGERRHFLK
jgi:hypothetical protein